MNLSNKQTITNVGSEDWWKNGEIHREDDSIVEYADGNKYWWKNYKLHRLYGPAIEFANGTIEWYQNGKLHRLSGPAIEHANGTKEWWQNGKLHRLDGPAIEFADGDKYWYIDDVAYTEEDYNARIHNISDNITYKFNEPKLLQDIKEYIDSTYNKHYSKHKLQTTEVVIDNGHGVGFCLGNASKYIQRYGLKGDENDWRADLIKAIHYLIINLYIHDTQYGEKN